jgi:hypothetical protein
VRELCRLPSEYARRSRPLLFPTRHLQFATGLR